MTGGGLARAEFYRVTTNLAAMTPRRQEKLRHEGHKINRAFQARSNGHEGKPQQELNRDAKHAKKNEIEPQIHADSFKDKAA